MANVTFQAGRVDFHQSVIASTSEMREWEPERIKQFFGGVAKVIRACAEESQQVTAMRMEQAAIATIGDK